MKKICVITGGTNGIGKEITLNLIKHNFIVYVLSRNKEDKQLEKLYGKNLNYNIFFIPIDLEDISQVKKIINYIHINIKKVDLFIWNSGTAVNQITKPYLTKDKLNKLYQINFISHALMTLNLINHYPDARYVFISSILSNPFFCDFDMFELNSMKYFTKNTMVGMDYGISKYYMNIFSKYLNSKYNIDTLSIEPGFVKSTNMNSNRNKYILKMNELFITNSNSMNQTLDFLISNILIKSKHSGDLLKFNGYTINEYSEYNTFDLINTLIILSKKFNIKNKLKLEKNELYKIEYNNTYKYKISNHFKQLTMLYPFLVYIIALIYSNNKKLNYFVLLYIFICNNITKILQRIIAQDRPPKAIDDGMIIQNKRTKSYGMPSLHAQNSFLLATILYYSKIDFKNKLFFIACAIVISLSRYFYNLHTLKQVIAGILFGIFNGYLYIKYGNDIINTINRNKTLSIIIFSLLAIFLITKFMKIYIYNKKCLNSKIPEKFIDKHNKYDINQRFKKKIIKNSNYNKYFFNCLKDLSYTLSSQVITWNQIDNMLLNNNIPSKKFDCAVGIFSGGGFICKRLANILKINSVYYIESKLWTDQKFDNIFKLNDNTRSNVFFIGLNNINNKDILLIDDSVYTGITIKSCKEFLLKHGAKSVSTYAMITKNKNLVNYYSKSSNKIPLFWPWGFELN